MYILGTTGVSVYFSRVCITMLLCILFPFLYLMRMNPKKYHIAAMWWDKKTVKRIADFCAKNEQLCYRHDKAGNTSYRKNHKKRIAFAIELGKLLNNWREFQFQ